MRPVCRTCSTEFDQDPKNPVSLYCPPCRIDARLREGAQHVARATAVVALPCHRCGQWFERKRRGRRTIHCPTCREALARQKANNRYAAARRQVDGNPVVRAALRGVNDRERAYRAAATALAPDCAVPDRMPSGSTTPLGSDDGRSTFFKDLAEELDGLAAAAVRHTCRDKADKFAHHTKEDCGGCFWEKEPHWYVDLHLPR